MQLSLLLIRLYKILESNKKKYVFLPFILYWIILLGLTSYPADGIPVFGIGDKFEHLFAYLVLSIFMQLTFHFQERYINLKKNHVYYTIVISVIYGILDELHQYYIPGRFCDILDLISNIIGTLIAVVLVNYFINRGSDTKNLSYE